MRNRDATRGKCYNFALTLVNDRLVGLDRWSPSAAMKRANELAGKIRKIVAAFFAKRSGKEG